MAAKKQMKSASKKIMPDVEDAEVIEEEVVQEAPEEEATPEYAATVFLGLQQDGRMFIDPSLKDYASIHYLLTRAKDTLLDIEKQQLSQKMREAANG